MPDRILILDFGSQFTQLIARRVREHRVYSEVHSFDLSLDEIRAKAPIGVILSAAIPSLNSSERAESAARAILPADETRTVSQPNGRIDATVAPHGTTKANASGRDAVSASGIAGMTATLEMPIVLKSRLCATLDDWLCEPADRPVPAGMLFYFTQVTSTAATTIQHRWYRDNRLMKSVDLPILPKPDVGYRSFSRYSMDRDSAGSDRTSGS